MTAPTLSGSITITNLSTTGFDMSWPPATLNGSTSAFYDLSFNDGFSYPVQNLTSTTFNFPSGTAGATYNLRIKVRNSANEYNDPSNQLTLSVTLPMPDTTAPTLTSPTGTATGSTTASGTVSTSESGGTLYRLASINATETVATVKAANLTQSVTATGTQNVSFTGLTSSTTYYAHYVHRDAAGNDSTVANSASFTTSAPPADTTPPSFTGALVITNLGGNSFTATASAASDAGGGITYDYSTDGGSTWGVTGWPAPTYNFSGLTTGALIQLRARAKDAAGNYSTPVLSSAVQLLATPDAQASITTHPQSVSVAPGATVTLTYAAAGSPVPTVTLQRSTNGGVSWTAVSGAGATSYTTPALTTGDTGVRYRVVAVNEMGSNQYTAISNEATITVTASTVTGTVMVSEISNGSGGLLTNYTFPNVVVLQRSNRALLLALTNQTTNNLGHLTIASTSLAAGVPCQVVAFSADGLQAGCWPATVS